MQRRSLLRGLAALVAGGVGAGCSNNQEVPATAPRAPVTRTPEPYDPPDGGVAPPDVDVGDDFSTPPDDTGGLTATPTPTLTPTTEPPALESAGLDYVEGEEGSLVVVVSVRNRTGESVAGTVVVTASAGDESARRRASATVAAGETRDVRVAFPFEYDAFLSDPSVSVRIREGTPAGGGTATDGAPSTSTESAPSTQTDSTPSTPTTGGSPGSASDTGRPDSST